MKYLFFVFIIVPALEIGLFILAGKSIGVLATVALIILTGLLGAYLAKRQGMEALKKVQEQWRQGQPPGNAMLDGLCVLVGGIMLLAPGFITDIIGMLLLLPITKNLIRPLLLKMLKKHFLQKKQVYISLKKSQTALFLLRNYYDLMYCKVVLF
ncbi:FxsA family protein [Bacillus sp. FSL K6-3431]|uniref:FxsA family protein n=1 Tax=Bacillus sp. FSL K6-3431 TaxID=2921500 RepID=UPI0030FA1757